MTLVKAGKCPDCDKYTQTILDLREEVSRLTFELSVIRASHTLLKGALNDDYR